MEIVAVVMAGGVGSRFWPRSRQEEPKQLLNLFTDHSMIQSTVKRLNPLVKSENIYIVTSNIYKDTILDQLPDLKEYKYL